MNDRRCNFMDWILRFERKDYLFRGNYFWGKLIYEVVSYCLWLVLWNMCRCYFFVKLLICWSFEWMIYVCDMIGGWVIFKNIKRKVVFLCWVVF